MNFSEQAVRSADGTMIAYRRVGQGPAIVVVPGNNRMAHHYDRVAGALADAFTMCVIERRGRGASVPQGPHYSLEREVEDLHAVADAVGALDIVGHSYGGLVALTAARTSWRFERVAVYEPAISIDGSFDLSFLGRFRRLLARRKHVRAMALFFHRTGLIPLPLTPYLVCWALSVLLVGRRGENRALMPTTAPELAVVGSADSDGSPYAAVRARTLLLRGTIAPAYLTKVLDPLAAVIPDATLETLDGADHNAPDESAPTRVAESLRDFFG